MKLSSLRYLAREGFRNIWQNRFMSIASVAVLIACLLLTGAAYLVVENVNHAFQWIYGQNVVVVFSDVDSTEQEVAALGDSLKQLDNVANVEFLSKEDMLKKYGEALPETTFESLQGANNPLPDSYIVTFADLALFDQTISQIEALPKVDEASYDGDIAETLTTVRQVALTVGLWTILLLLTVSLFIIINTIKLTVYNRRLEIYIMRSVGATGAFIRIPFIIEGMTLGLLSAGISFFVVWLLYDKVLQLIPMTASLFSLVPFANVWSVLLIGFVTIGILTGMTGSFIATGKYLHKEGSEKVC
jgi:cell division transport system permease protein